MMPEVRAVRSGANYLIQWTEGEGKEVRWASGTYFRQENAWRSALKLAVDICARTDKPVLVQSSQGAFEIRPGMYPQQKEA